MDIWPLWVAEKLSGLVPLSYRHLPASGLPCVFSGSSIRPSGRWEGGWVFELSVAARNWQKVILPCPQSGNILKGYILDDRALGLALLDWSRWNDNFCEHACVRVSWQGATPSLRHLPWTSCRLETATKSDTSPSGPYTDLRLRLNSAHLKQKYLAKTVSSMDFSIFSWLYLWSCNLYKQILP